MAEFLEDQTVESPNGQGIALAPTIVETRCSDRLGRQELPALKRADGNFVTTLTLNSRTCKWPIGDSDRSELPLLRPAAGNPAVLIVTPMRSGAISHCAAAPISGPSFVRDNHGPLGGSRSVGIPAT